MSTYASSKQRGQPHKKSGWSTWYKWLNPFGIFFDDSSSWRSDDDKWYTSLVKHINHYFNPNHQWTDYDSWNNNQTAVDDWINSVTGHGMTTREIQENAMQMQNQEDEYARQVAGMQKAGVNPSLMYGSGGASNSAPSVQSHDSPMSMSDLMSVFLLRPQRNLLEAQARNVDSQTDKNAADTENMRLINKYYPEVTETQISKVLSDMGVNDSVVLRNVSEVELNALEADLKDIDKVIRQAEADNASDFYKARVQLQNAQTYEAHARASEALADAAIKELDKKYMKEHDAKMGSSGYIAIASAIAALFDVDTSKGSFAKGIQELPKNVIKRFSDWVNRGLDWYIDHWNT